MLPLPNKCCYTYLSEPLDVGTLVYVPFGKKILPGCVWDVKPDVDFPSSKLKPILNILDIPPLSEKLIRFMQWVSQYNLMPLGNALKMFISGMPSYDIEPRKKFDPYENPLRITREFPLTEEQSICVQEIERAHDTSTTFLLDGVTGSGKTEVYYENILHVVERGKQALILLPEIALTHQWIDRFKDRFHVTPAYWHSNLKITERRNIWQSVLKGEVPIVVGARSALFLPFPNLGLVVVDEEHDSSYKQEEGGFYNARDMAVLRGKLDKCPVVLASATPSLESLYNVQVGKYETLNLSNRFGEAAMPEIFMVDMRKKEETKDYFPISVSLKNAVDKALKSKEQVLLFLNRRGFAPVTLCTSCGHKVTCADCSTHMVQYRRSGKEILQCHHCGAQKQLPESCPDCNEQNSLKDVGVGVEKLEEAVRVLWPFANIQTVSSDTMGSSKKLEKLYHDISNHSVDIIIGTQMMAKGHDFPNITLVGVIDADAGLMNCDLRAAEQTYQVLHQVAGRCGRGQKKGRVYIQTYSPSHPVLEALASFDREAFISVELDNRQDGMMPPFGRLAALIISSNNKQEVEKVCRELARSIPLADGIQVLGPAPAPLEIVRGKTRWRFLVISQKGKQLQAFIRSWVGSIDMGKSLQIKVDIDPYSFF